MCVAARAGVTRRSAYLHVASRAQADYHLRVLPVDRAVARVERQDGDAEEGQLASPWSVETAAQMLSALTNSDFAESLLFDGGWSPSALLVRTFVSTAEPAVAVDPATSAAPTAFDPGHEGTPGPLSPGLLSPHLGTVRA